MEAKGIKVGQPVRTWLFGTQVEGKVVSYLPKTEHNPHMILARWSAIGSRAWVTLAVPYAICAWPDHFPMPEEE